METFDLDKMKMGYIIAYESDGSFVSRIIEDSQFLCGHSRDQSKYTHVEISGGGEWSIGAVIPKSKLIKITKRYKGRKAILLKPLMDNYDVKRYKVAFFGATLSNQLYGWWTLPWFLLKRVFNKLLPWGNRGTPFCSLLCAWAIDKEYPDIFKDYKEVMPADFISNPLFEVVWEGFISDKVEDSHDTKLLKKLMEDI